MSFSDIECSKCGKLIPWKWNSHACKGVSLCLNRYLQVNRSVDKK